MEQPKVRMIECPTCEYWTSAVLFGMGAYQFVTGYKGYDLFTKKPVQQKSLMYAISLVLFAIPFYLQKDLLLRTFSSPEGKNRET